MKTLARIPALALGLAVAATSLVPGLASAQWRSTGLPVCTAVNQQNLAATAPDGTGGAFLVWEDWRTAVSTNRDVYAQHVLASGVPDPAWPANGLAVCTATNMQNTVSIISDGAGGAFVSWLDYRNGSTFQPFVHHLTSSGVDGTWPSNGRQLLTSANSVTVDVQMARDGSTGVYALVSVPATGTNLTLQHVTGGGAIDANFTANGVIAGNSTDSGVRGAIVRDNAGGAIVLWTQTTTGALAMRVQSSGAKDPAWPAAGRNLTTPISASAAAIVAVSDQAGGAIAAWNQMSGGAHDIYSQHIAVTGVVDAAWPATGLVVCGATGVQALPRICTDGGTGAFVAWQDLRNGNDYDVYAQHVLAAGVRDPAWTANGVAVLIATGSQNLVEILPASPSGALLVWDDIGSAGVRGLIAQKIGAASGNVDPSWPTSGAAIAPYDYGYSSRGISTDGNGGVFVAWNDYRLGRLDARAFDVYLRQLTSTPTHRITPTIGAGGTSWVATPDSVAIPTAAIPHLDVTAAERTDFRFTATGANAISNVTVDLVSQGVVPNVTLTNVTANTALGVTFSSALWNVDINTPGQTYAPAGWPLTFADSTVATLLPTLWPSDDSRWRLAHWDPTSSRYVYASDSLGKLQAGAGYWLATMAPQLITVGGHPINAASVSVPLAGGVASGWNQVANPYRFPIADSALRVVVGANTHGFTAVGNTAVEHAVYDYTGSAYVSVHTLQPNRSYWVHKMVDGAVSLKFPNLSSTGPAPALPGLPDGAEWAVGVVARQGATATAPVMMGAGAASRDEGTPLRRESPPPAPQGGLTLHAGEPGEAHVRQISDLVAGGAPTRWVLELAGAEAPGEVQLVLDGYALPAGMTLWLGDPAAGWTREVHAGETVTLAAHASARRLTLEASFGGPASGTSATLAMSAYPNPFRGAIGLRAALPASSDVRVRILDLQGRLVRTLDRALAPAGESVMLWDGRSASGELVRPGVYLARWQAGAATGAVRLVKID